MIEVFGAIAGSIAFRREATGRNCDPGHATRFPLIKGSLIFAASTVVQLLFGSVFPRVGTSTVLAEALGWGASLFFVVLYFLVLSKNWRAIRKLPLKFSNAAPASSDS
jgi:hypothetical protein